MMNKVATTSSVRVSQLTLNPGLMDDALRKLGVAFTARVIHDPEALPALLTSFPSQIIVLDQRAGLTFDVTQALRVVAKVSAFSKAIVISDQVCEAKAIELAELGAFDYINADHLERLPACVMRALSDFEEKQAWFRSKEAFEAVYKQSRDAIITGSLNGIFFNCNAAAVDLFGYSGSGEFLKLIPVDLCPPAQPDGRLSPEMIGAMISKAMKDGSAWSEVTFRRQDGSLFLGSTHINACSAAGHDFFQVTIRDITEERSTQILLATTTSKLARTLNQTVIALAKAIEARDPYTAGHQKRVGSLAYSIGEQMGLPSEKLVGLYFGGLVHDIGKIQVPAEILVKPNRLSTAERLLIESHPQCGYDILKDIDFAWPIATVAHQHHERLNGSGYPQGLRGNQIDFDARIVAVADVVEAMSAHRPYRPSLGIAMALQEISTHSGTRYDKAVVDACLSILKTEADLEALASRDITLECMG